MEVRAAAKRKREGKRLEVKWANEEVAQLARTKARDEKVAQDERVAKAKAAAAAVDERAGCVSLFFTPRAVSGGAECENAM